MHICKLSAGEGRFSERSCLKKGRHQVSASNLHTHVHAHAQAYVSPTGIYILKEQIVNKIEAPVINGEHHSLPLLVDLWCGLMSFSWYPCRAGVMSSCYRCENWCPKRLRNLSEAWQLINNWAMSRSGLTTTPYSLSFLLSSSSWKWVICVINTKVRQATTRYPRYLGGQQC